jgi:hypothetical protein
MNKNIIKITLNVMMGIKFTTLLKLVFRKGLGLHPKYIIRFLPIVPNAIISQVLVMVEAIKYGGKIKRTKIEKPPVFIIGHWRSGTTLLHQLISLDYQFTTPTLVQTIIPDHFLFSTKYYVPILNKMLPGKRPMDEVVLEPLAPMEDEFGLVRMGSASPFEKLLFPSANSKFLADLGEFIPKGKELVTWKKNLHYFLKKITLLAQKRIVLKNPFHTPRVALLSEMFPGAKFIHIVRHPYKIIPSSINMWNIVANENAFKTGWEKPTINETAEVLYKFWVSVDENKGKLDKNEFVVVRYEDLEINPVKELRRMYGELNFEFTSEFESRIIDFMEANKDYKKNVFNLSYEEKSDIYKRLNHYFHAYNYEK